ncbi:MAG: asparagine synthase (glutamine-hydrolyzing), partial [Gammaproteobacteria bacterium]|nr:asparagine synthase (glutamine-hydrolyzing) [Gammaproteobacteria bacterium]
EIYNFRALRQTLEGLGHAFRGHSDTEVMLAAFEAWGVKAALERFSGMFAFALADLQAREVIFARDRMGEKPLYYGIQNGVFLFGSELKALRCHPAWQGALNSDVLPLLLRHNFISGPETIYQRIFRLPPGSWMRIRFDLKQADAAQPEPYWQPDPWLLPGPFGTLEEATHELDRRLREVVQEQMVSDVPLGAFLSGGVDSSTVVAVMQQLATQPVRSFSIGFDEPGFNEAEHAKAVAAHVGTQHTELYVTGKDALDVIPRLPAMYDEPFADSSQIPTWLVSRMTREHVTVALSGDGGDELFCGYTRYMSVANAWARRGRPSAHVRKALGMLPAEWIASLVRLLPGQRGRSTFALAERIRFESQRWSAPDLSEFYRRGVSYWADPGQLLRAGQEPVYGLNKPLCAQAQGDPHKTLMWRDLQWYLPDDILVKVDRAAMACSLETRVPLLDRRIVEFALGLPVSMNVQHDVGKQVLRSVLYRYVPRSLIERPKQGFAVPVGAWLRGPLRDWAENLLSRSRLEQSGVWNSEPIRACWDDHLRGREDNAFQLWGVLMFQAWRETL